MTLPCEYHFDLNIHVYCRIVYSCIPELHVLVISLCGGNGYMAHTLLYEQYSRTPHTRHMTSHAHMMWLVICIVTLLTIAVHGFVD